MKGGFSGVDLVGCFVLIAGTGLPAVAAASPKYKYKKYLLWQCWPIPF